MPIANAYLSSFHLAGVRYPQNMVTVNGSDRYTSDPFTVGAYAPYSKALAVPPSLSSSTIAYTKYDVRTEQDVSSSELVQAWPGAKFFSVGAISHIHNIELPVILVPSASASTSPSTSPSHSYRVRVDEIRFWLSWLVYMFSTYDRASWTVPDEESSGVYSAVVESAGVRATTDGLRLSLSIRTNAPMGWNLLTSSQPADGVDKIVGRSATNYDTFVKYENYSEGNSPQTYRGVGIDDFWGVNQFDLNAKTSFETVSHTPYHIDTSSTTASGEWLVSDQINAKMVTVDGSLDGFGNVSGKTLEPRNISLQSSAEYNMDIVSPSALNVWDDPFSVRGTGGMQVYVGAGVESLGVVGQALFLLPTGTLVSQGGISSSGNGTVSISRRWHGTITNAPSNGATGLKALIGI